MIFSSIGPAADQASQPNFSGKYSLKTTKGADYSLFSWGSTIEVVQNANSLEIIVISDGKRVTNRFPLDGAKVACLEDAHQPTGKLKFLGGSGLCSGNLKKQKLNLKITVSSDPNAPVAEVWYREEHWSFPADSKSLRIDRFFYIPVPGFSSTMGMEPTTMEYTRVDGP
jgi:hypothetical protein